MAAIDPVRNFGKVTLATGIAAGATSASLVSGDGAKLPDPSTEGAFNMVLWDWTTYREPSDDPNKEIVRVTANVADVLTITRAQEGTSDVAHNTVGKTYKMVNALTKAVMDIIRDHLTQTIGGIFFGGADTYPAVDSSNLFWDNTNKQLLLGSGGAGNPSHSFLADPTLGWYRAAANRMVLAIAGNARADFGASSFILGSYNTVGATTLDFAFNGSTPRFRLGVGWYVQLQQTGGLSGAEMIGDLYPLTDLDTSALMGDLTRRFNKMWVAQINTGVLGNSEYNFVPIYNERALLNSANPPISEHYSKRKISITTPATSTTIGGVGGWWREIVNEVAGVGSTIVNDYAELRMTLTQVTATGGVIDDSAHFWESFERAAVDWDILITGAHRNRYNWIIPVVQAVGVPDLWTKAFGANYVLPDFKYTLELTGNLINVVVKDKFGVTKGTAYIHLDGVVTNLAVDRCDGKVNYHAFDSMTLMEIYSSCQLQSLINTLIVHYGGTVVTSDAVPVLYGALRRYP